MFKNYLKITIRNLIKHKLYTVLNISGLAIGIACSIFILLWVSDELKFDKYHEKANQIYRIITRSTEDDKQGAIQPAVMLTHFQSEFPEIEQVVRLHIGGESIINHGDLRFVENGFLFADADIFDVFSFQLVAGDLKTALREPFSVILTETTAKKYFNDRNPIGEIISYENEHDFTVTGIMKNIPYHSHFRFDFLASISSMNTINNYMMTDWRCSGTYYYFILPEHAQKADLENRLTALFKRGKDKHSTAGIKLVLEPLTKTYLHSTKTVWDIGQHGDISYVYGFSAIAFLILLIACINYMNLATARSNLRAKEIGLRKTLGASRQQIIKQFMGESFIIALMAFVAAIVLVELLLPVFNNITAKALTFNLFSDLALTGWLILILLFVSVISGGYAAFFLSKPQPLDVLKPVVSSRGSNNKSYQFNLRSVLVLLQFGITIMLIICTLLIYKQMRYIGQARLGFEKEQIVVISNPWNNFNDMKSRYERFRNTVQQHSKIQSVSAAFNVPPGNINNSTRAWIKGTGQNADEWFGLIAVDYDYLSMMGAEFVEGRNFSQDFTTDKSQAVIINKTALRALGLKSSNRVQLTGINNTGDEPQTIIGVIKDMHYKSMHEPVRPMIFYLKDWCAANIIAKINAEDIPSTIKYLRDQWGVVAPDWPFQYYFVDEKFDTFYRAEQRVSLIVLIFTSIAIFIACLGLYGLVSFTAERRTKEIGIRKVLGASVSGIVALLSKEFIKWVLVANFIAWPIAYYAMNKWLQNFAYRINIDWWTFLLAGALALVIALLTVSYQAIRAATANPVEALRYE